MLVFPRFAPALALGLLLASTPAWATSTDADVVQSWTARDGLPEDEVNSILQTRDGYVWIATNAGLARFDGARFRVFTPENTPAMRSSRVFNLLEARDGTLWFTTEDAGVGALRGGQFVAYPSDSSLGGAQARRPLETVDGSIWFSTSRGLARFRNGAMVMVAPNELREPTLILADDRAGGVWTSTRSGVAHVTDAGVKQWRLDAESDGHGFWHPFVDRSGRVWLGTSQGLMSLEGAIFVPFRAPGLPPAEPWRVFYDDPDSDFPVMRSTGAWARFRSGAWHVLRPGPLTVYKNEPVWDGSRLWAAIGPDVYLDDERRFAGLSQVTGLMRDREGGVWIATANQGVFRLAPSGVATVGGREGLNRIVTAIGEDGGTRWLTAFGEGMLAIRDGREWSPPAGDIPRNINDLLFEAPGRWIAASVRGVERLTLETGRPVGVEPIATTFGGATALGRARDGTLWANTDAGLLRLRGGVARVLPESLTHTRAPATAFVEDGRGRMWIGTQGAGLLVVQGDRVTNIGMREGLPTSRVECLAADGDDAMWVGLTGAGLAHVELPRTGAPLIRVLAPTDGLPSPTIVSLLVAERRMWMGTPDGPTVTDLAALRARLAGGKEPLRAVVFDERDGMLSRRCARGRHAVQLGSDGRVWFATRNGAVAIDPVHALASSPLSPPIVEEVLSGSREVPAVNGAVTLASDSRDVTIRYTALNFHAPAWLRFRYRLRGVDRDWVDAGARREAIYSNVPAGTHRFEVMVRDRSGRWSPVVASRSITVRPAFYETWAFRVLVVALLVALAVALYRLRVRQYQRRQSELAGLVAQRTRELEAALAQVAAQTRSLEDLDRAKSRFFANISHEFRTPLTLTLGPLEDVLSGATGELPGEARTELDVALRNSRRLLQLVNEILDLAKLESGRLALAARESDLCATLGDWALAFHPLAERKRIRFVTDLGDEPLMVWFDRERLGKPITNLLANAFKFTPDGGTVTLRARREAGASGEVRIDVTDTGPGIPEDERERIFDRFYQVDTPQRRVTPGTGIGLALARELVELHGGRIAVESPPGQGATFTVWLKTGHAHLAAGQIASDDAAALIAPPVSAVEVPAPATNGASSAPDLEREPGDVTTVLVVDDNDELRALVRRGLVSRYRVVEAADGEEALAMARAALPDLVVSDVMMPGLDGFQLVEAFRADPELDFVPIVLLTARAEAEDRIAGLTRGADDYIEKPFRADELRARVDNLIASRQRLRERFSIGFRIRSTAAPSDAIDRAYLERLREVIGARLGEEDFSVARLAEAMRQDRTQLFRKVRDLLGVAPADLLRGARLERAAELLTAGEGNVGEIAYATGFKSVSHFSNAFRLRYGDTPSAYARRGDEARATAASASGAGHE